MTDTDNGILPQHFIKALHERFLAMENACIKVKAAIHASGSDFPIYVPQYSVDKDAQMSEPAREAALKSITQLFHTREGEFMAEAGVLCASPETVKVIEQLNVAKGKFKDAIKDIRLYQKDTDIAVAKFDKLIRDEITEKGLRSNTLNDAMGTAGIRSLDLKRCYAQIRIMPKRLDVFSWTWAKTHSRIKKVSIKEAMAMARALTGDRARDTAIDILSQCPSNETLVRKIGLPPQLRANYAYKEDDSIIRKSCPVSGIVIAQQVTLPRMFWREKPVKTDDDSDRLPRISTIENESFVTSLHLHRYVK